MKGMEEVVVLRAKVEISGTCSDRLAGAGSFAAGVLAAALIGFGTGGEFDVVPYLLSRHFGLRSLSTLYGLHWTA